MAHENCVIDMKLCDDSTAQEVYEDTRYGKIQARDRYWEMVHNAKENSSILSFPPHIVWIKLTMPKVDPKLDEEVNSVEHTADCPCQKQVLANA